MTSSLTILITYIAQPYLSVEDPSSAHMVCVSVSYCIYDCLLEVKAARV